jgi:hypothetical protein
MLLMTVLERTLLITAIPGLIRTREKQQPRVNPERLPLSFETGPFEKTIGWYNPTVLQRRFA